MARFDIFLYPEVLEMLADQLEDPEDYRKLTEAHVFYGDYAEFTSLKAGQRISPDVLFERIEQLSLPYPVCYLEQTGDNCWRSRVASQDHKWAGQLVGVPWIFFIERSATKIDAIFASKGIDVGSPVPAQLHSITLDLLDPDWNHAMYAMAMTILDVFCAKLRSSTIGSEKYTRQIPIRIGNHKYTKSIGRVIRLHGKHEAAPAPAFARTIEWESSWFVRGHWRLLPGGIGKDRDGVYNQKGSTWVKHHVRGNPDAEPERKPYLV
jgi:hypothetical protein